MTLLHASHAAIHVSGVLAGKNLGNMGNRFLLLFSSDKMAAVALCEIARVSYPCSFPAFQATV